MQHERTEQGRHWADARAVGVTVRFAWEESGAEAGADHLLGGARPVAREHHRHARADAALLRVRAAL
eukprot:8092706-Alexandrium_andersonii.AAC.1